jgi:hypothetical protein
MDNLSNNDQAPQAPARPTFLTVLCVLSFLGSAYGILNNLNGFMNAGKMPMENVNQMLDSARTEINREAQGTPGAAVAEKVLSGATEFVDPAKLKKMSLYLLMANILTLGGAYLMFQLKKQGFWMYVVGTALAVLTPLIIYGAGNLVSIMMTVALGFIGVVFAVMYAVNLKHMS